MKNISVKKIRLKRLSKFFLNTILLFTGFLHYYGLYAKSFITNNKIYIENPIDTNIESKVDYLEKIYFSGKNKEGLNDMILETIQDLEGKTGTSYVAVQYSFLTGIKNNANSAKDACEVEEMLAAGIYGLDVREALNEKIPKPSNETTSQVEPAVNTARSISSSVGDVALTRWYLSNGTATGAAKTGIAAYKVSSATYTASRTAQTIN